MTSGVDERTPPGMAGEVRVDDGHGCPVGGEHGRSLGSVQRYHGMHTPPGRALCIGSPIPARKILPVYPIGEPELCQLTSWVRAFNRQP